jgi:hypothetical protein
MRAYDLTHPRAGKAVPLATPFRFLIIVRADDMDLMRLTSLLLAL